MRKIYNLLVAPLVKLCVVYILPIRILYAHRLFRKFDTKNNTLRANNRSGLPNVTALWDSDGRFKWLELVSSEIPSFNINHFQRALFRIGFEHYILRAGYGSDISVGESNITIFFEEKYKVPRQKYKKYCESLARIIGKYYSTSIFLFPKLNDDWIIDAIGGVRAAGFKIVVHDREYGITQQRMTVYTEILMRYMSHMDVDLLCLTNNRHKEFFKKSGFDESKMIVTGKPDTDFWFKNHGPITKDLFAMLKPDRIKLLYFSFGKNNYMNFYYKGETRNWDQLCSDYHDVMLQLLIKYKGRIQLIYKTGGKPNRDLFSKFEDFESALIEHSLEDEVLFLKDNLSTLELIRSVDMVFGFQTLGLTEAMFTNKPIAYGAWGELYDDIKETLLPYHRTDALYYAKTKLQLFDYLDTHISTGNFILNDDQTLQARKSELNDAYNYPDGAASSKLANSIIGVIN